MRQRYALGFAPAFPVKARVSSGLTAGRRRCDKGESLVSWEEVCAHAAGLEGAGATIVVIDTGVQHALPELAPLMLALWDDTRTASLGTFAVVAVGAVAAAGGGRLGDRGRCDGADANCCQR